MKSISFFILLLFIFFSCESKNVQTEPETVPEENSEKITVEKSSVNFLKENKSGSKNDTIEAAQFGVKADFNGKTGTDNRMALQRAIDFSATNNKVLRLPPGKILVNSYGTTPAAKAHANILELKSNTNIIGNKSEIIIGKTFHDRPFVLLSGLNAVNIKDFTNLQNISIKNITFNFNHSQVYMVSKYQLMRGIEMGHCINGEISGCVFTNGDLTAAIITGQGNRSVSENVKIHHNKFFNLIKSAKNQDHTSVYLNSLNSSVYENSFANNSDQGKIVACAGELHNSNSSFHDNTISGYLRMNFVAAMEIENHHIKNLKIYNNTARLTSAAVYLWTDDNTSITDLSIRNNTILSSHVDGYTMFYNGTQGIFADATVGSNTLVTNLTIENNQTTILKTNIKGRAVNFMFEKNRKIENFKEKNNSCKGCNDGKYYESGFKWPF